MYFRLMKYAKYLFLELPKYTPRTTQTQRVRTSTKLTQYRDKVDLFVISCHEIFNSSSGIHFSAAANLSPRKYFPNCCFHETTRILLYICVLRDYVEVINHHYSVRNRYQESCPPLQMSRERRLIFYQLRELWQSVVRIIWNVD